MTEINATTLTAIIDIYKLLPSHPFIGERSTFDYIKTRYQVTSREEHTDSNSTDTMGHLTFEYTREGWSLVNYE